MELAADILRTGGAWADEHPPEVRAQSHRRIRRNRLISGCACGLIVIETGLGGAMHAARAARDQGRPVAVAVPEAVPEDAALPEGNPALLAQGATPLRSPADADALP